ncbi:hypothetical protein DSO57_1033957 [Entomophthora muscae]|uniref:Uncharacterized protein n=1 Tax=Entomophthora muscae TaxID=34485 RepID=A0ACC2U8Z6_9FUNG|nr:hypothetical protein DSO57_1033957 [Entomophthora muscae]
MSREALAGPHILRGRPERAVTAYKDSNTPSTIFLILFHLHTPKCQHPPTGIDNQTPVDKTKAFEYYRSPNTLFGPIHFTEYPSNPDHKP